MPRVTVDLSDDAYKAIQEIAEELSTTKSEALRRSLGLMRFAVKEKKAGSKLIAENKDKDIRKEIVQL